MPSVMTSHGAIRYKTIPLFPGVKRIDKEIAFENLCLLKSILDANGIKFQLAFGTLLGVVREHDFIDHDEDIDLAFLDEDRNALWAILPDLMKMGFRVCRYDRRDLLSVMRKGEYIDFYFYRPWQEGYRICSGWVNVEKHLINTAQIEFKGISFPVPLDYEEYLVGEYGADWRIPLQWNNYQMPKWKIAMFNVKEHLKDVLPDWLFSLIAKRSERALYTKCCMRLNKNLGQLLPQIEE